MTDPIVAKRLIRNLRYKLTYVKIFEDYLGTDPGPVAAALLKSLIEAQQSAIAPLGSYLRSRDVGTQDLELNDKLLAHAATRDTLKARLRFIHDGLYRAAEWYKIQLADKQMTSDPDLKNLLFKLGEIDAAKLWLTEATMVTLKISPKLEEKDWDETTQPEPKDLEEWRPRLVEDVGRPAWGGKQTGRFPRPSPTRRKDPSDPRGR
jgi:hypothetical protein